MKNLYSPSEIYKVFFDYGRTAKYMRKAKKKKELSPQLIERIMLAVTEVNKCEMCSYAHTKMALEKGLCESEIQALLSGEFSTIPNDEATAILFAQHYADFQSKPTEKAWDTLLETYGEVKAKGILGVVRTITLGNSLGIPFGSFINRIKGKKPDSRSNIGYELCVILMLFFVSPIGVLHGLIYSWFSKKLF